MELNTINATPAVAEKFDDSAIHSRLDAIETALTTFKCDIGAMLAGINKQIGLIHEQKAVSAPKIARKAQEVDPGSQERLDSLETLVSDVRALTEGIASTIGFSL